MSGIVTLLQAGNRCSVRSASCSATSAPHRPSVRESFVDHHRLPLDPPHILGVLSMLIWALILVVTVK
jgi:hypothetical protein